MRSNRQFRFIRLFARKPYSGLALCISSLAFTVHALAALLFATVYLALPRIAHATGGQCVYEGGPGAPTYPACAIQDCIGAGGKAQCEAPAIRPATNLNDAQSDGQEFNYIFTTANEYDAGGFCNAAGGTWNGFNGNPQCAVSLPPGYNSTNDASSEGTANAGSDAFIALKFSNPACPASLQTDTGWGQTNGLWGATGPISEDGQIVWDQKSRIYTSCGSPYTVGLLRTRQVVCRENYSSRTLPNGSVQCFIPADTGCCVVGNPVSPVTGAKMDTAIEYRSGSLEVSHFYNSTGGARITSTSPFISAFSDYWHFNYDRMLTPVSGNSQLMAIVVRENGTNEAFDGSGNEVLNRTGSADRLVNNGSGWTLTLANNDVETYNAAGNLTSIKTRDGVVNSISYGGNGKISSVSDSFGHTLSYGYNSNNQLTSVTLPDGTSKIGYGYDTLGRLASVTYADLTSISYQYEDPSNSWLLSGITDESAQRFATYRYTTQGTVSHEEHAGGVAAYDFSIGGSTSAEIVSTITDPLRQSRQYVLDNQNGVFKLRYATPYCPTCPNVSQSAFDANGNPQSQTDLNNHQTTFTYDLTRNLELSRTEGLSGGQVTTATRTVTTQWHPSLRLPTQIAVYSGGTATGTATSQTSYSYDGYGNVLTRTVTDPLTASSRTWTYSYYNSGLYGQVHTIDGPRTDVSDVTTYTYYNCTSGHECGHVQTVVDALGHTTTFNTYDANGQPLTVTDANGTVTTLTYDLRQHIKSVTVGGEQTQFAYWPTGLLQKITRPDSSYISYVYDPAHRLTEVDDALGDRVVYTLDAAGNRQAAQTYGSGSTLTRTHTQIYNSLGLLWENLTAAGSDSQATILSYDAGGNNVTVNAPLSRNTLNGFDALNRLQQITDPNQGVTKLAYNVLDQVTGVTDPRQLATAYSYTGLGDLSQVQSPDTGLTKYTFDGAGNVQTSMDARSLTATNTFDALNRLSKTAYGDETLNFYYDQGTNGIGHLTSFTDASGQTSFTYDGLGRIVTKQQVVGGVALAVSYGYANGRMSSMTTPSGQVLAYAYNANHQITGITLNGAALISGATYMPFGPSTGWTWGNGTLSSRTYDLDGKPISINSAGTSTYAYNDDASIASRSDDWPSTYDLTSGTTTPTIAATSNQVTATAGALSRTYSYDLAGHVTGFGSATFLYNDAGRMSGATVGGAGFSYGVNAVGQRVRKIVGVNTTLFVYDEAGHLIGEYTGSGGLIEETVWLGDTPIATLQPASGGGINTFYIHTDHLNAPRRITRKADNVVVWRWDSDPFGAATANEDPDGDGVLFVYNQRFPGQYYDTETGLSYNNFRDYDPQTGRYLESDPIGLFGGSPSTYSYVSNNPISNIDPLGLQTVPAVPVGPGPLIIPPVAVPGTPENKAFVDAAMGAIEEIEAAARRAAQAIHNACSESDEAREKRCQENLDRDLETCAALSKRDGKSAYAICAKQAYLRYGNCLSGRDSGIKAPLPPWGTK